MSGKAKYMKELRKLVISFCKEYQLEFRETKYQFYYVSDHGKEKTEELHKLFDKLYEELNAKHGYRPGNREVTKDIGIL